ncbi:MAG: CHAT domain-containing protein, partial [Caldilineaceae bacterium]|nr:CHAT domain-containing protein [Caldilineaceae bacterium]
VEERIATLWHALLVRNADYARDQWLDGEGTERTDTSSSFFEDKSDLTAMQARLPEDTALLSYYRGEQTLTLFVLTRDHITATTLPLSTAQLQRLIELLRLNMGMAAASDANHLPALVLHAQRILHQLYQQLLAPVHAKLAPYRSLIIVPHGPLHYLPFHALVTHLDPAQPATSRYLLDEYTVSYLPGASFLTAAHERKPQDGSWVALGHTYGGQLPHVLAEVQSIGALGKATVYTEADATKARLAEVAPAARLLHLATHGDFRAENPLFSGLALDDGWLSTLDIFHLRTNASLVTLSACQTGRSTLGGGDELLGLMRAFLAAGAASIVLTLWSVHDESTALFMTHFYHALIGGATKGAALRAAQLALRTTHASAGAAHPYAHPYFWAPFLLTGSAGSL